MTTFDYVLLAIAAVVLVHQLMLMVRAKRDVLIPGTPPNLKHPPDGCRFADRCKYATPECRYYTIPEKEFGDNRMYRCLKSLDELKEVYDHE